MNKEKIDIVLDYSDEQDETVDHRLRGELRMYMDAIALKVENAYIGDVDAESSPRSIRHYLRYFDSLIEWQMERLEEYVYKAFGITKEELQNPAIRKMISARLNNL